MDDRATGATVTARGAGLTVRCPAKLNLFLEVVRRRPDGYHDLDTVMQAVDLYDELRIVPHAEPELTLECDDASLPTDGRNLVLRAAIALRDRVGYRGGAHLALTKRIPAQAGLGGGSSDAAGALAGLNLAWRLGLSTADLHPVAAEVGSDVAFFLHGGTAHCTGRGEVVEPVAVATTFHYVLVCPPFGVATVEAYRRLGFPLTSAGARASILLREAVHGSVEGMGVSFFNRLEQPAFDIQPRLRDVKERLAGCGLFAGVAMTGSGSALFGICFPGEQARAADEAAAFGLGRVYAVRSVRYGVEPFPG